MAFTFDKMKPWAFLIAFLEKTLLAALLATPGRSSTVSRRKMAVMTIEGTLATIELLHRRMAIKKGAANSPQPRTTGRFCTAAIGVRLVG